MPTCWSRLAATGSCCRPCTADRHEAAHARPRQDALAINEVSLLRQTRQAAHVGIELNGQLRLDELICDGVMVATPAGSTAYNFSANGPILPLGANVMALTPIAPFRPRRWRGAVLKSGTEVRFRVLDPHKRPVSATADSHEVRDVTEVLVRLTPKATALKPLRAAQRTAWMSAMGGGRLAAAPQARRLVDVGQGGSDLVREQRERSVTLLFDPEHNLEERILAEQFTS